MCNVIFRTSRWYASANRFSIQTIIYASCTLIISLSIIRTTLLCFHVNPIVNNTINKATICIVSNNCQGK